MSSSFVECKILSIKVPVKCLKCGNTFEVDAWIADEQTTEIKDMGPEVQRIIEYDGECPKCGNHLYFEIYSWEYPPGFLEEIEIDHKEGIDFT
ncbi:hypothetical protein E3E51_02390 [Thermococcus sp. 21S7]|nr:hypothetical protein [Thermococcus sp. 21S7]